MITSTLLRHVRLMRPLEAFVAGQNHARRAEFMSLARDTSSRDLRRQYVAAARQWHRWLLGDLRAASRRAATNHRSAA